MRGRGLGKSVGDWVRLRRVGALVGLLLLSSAACDGDQASYAHDARQYDASVPDASVPDASVPDASVPDANLPDAGPPVGCDWNTYVGDVLVQSSAELAALEGYTHVDGELRIDGCEDCVDLTPLRCLTLVTGFWSDTPSPFPIEGGLFILGNPLLEDLTGLENLWHVGGTFRLAFNPSLTNLEGLDSFIEADRLWIYDNDSLTSLQGVETITSVGNLNIGGNAVLQDISALDHLSTAGTVSIGDNPSLSSLAGLGNLDSGNFYLTVSGNDSLTSLEGLSSNITSLLRVTVQGNASLTSLAGLENLTTVNGETGGKKALRVQGGLHLVQNPQLSDLSALGQLTTVENDIIEISHNASLPGCEICSLLAHMTNPPIWEISDNLADSCTPVPDNCP